MKKTFTFFIRHYLFWFFVFILFRSVFLLSLFPLPGDISKGEIFYSLFAGFKLDLSTASYFAIVPFLLSLIAVTGEYRFVTTTLKWYYLLVIFIVVLLSLSNIIVFKYWGTLLNNRGLAYAAQPTEMLASVTTFQLLVIFLIIAACMILFRYCYFRFLHGTFDKINGTILQRMLALVIIVPLLIIGLRGGLQLIPVNESNAAFSAHRVLNQVAINNIWYLGHNLKQSGIKEKNPYQYMPDDSARNMVHELVKPASSSGTAVFDLSEKPNLVIILLESWTADVIEPLGGIKGVTPEFTKLCSEGLLFTSVYSSGFRTDQALVSVLSGFPSQPNKSIIRFPDKTAKLPSITRELKNSGYATSFFYGGELGFANMNSYLLASGFNSITSIDDFKSGNLNSKWGAHDQYVLEKQIQELHGEQQPFFSVLLTLSTHEPFEVPIQTPFTGTSEPELFKKSAWYTDHCLGMYFEKVKTMPWFQNTIFVLLADHGHRLPLERDYYDPEMRKIPVLIWSPLLKPEYRNTTNRNVSGQHDIAATILASLGIPTVDFEWSNNMLVPSRNNFAYLSLDNAVTWIHDSTVVILPLEPGLPGYKEEISGQKPVKAYLQHLYGTFLAY